MNAAQKSFELAAKGAADGEQYTPANEEARRILEEAIASDSDPENPSIYVNYAAVLLNLGNHHQALDVLTKHPSDSYAYCANMAIAIVNTESISEIERIRYWNTKAEESPEKQYEITAYVDWMAY